MRRLVVVLPSLLFAALCASATEQSPLDTLKASWDSHMLAGRRGVYQDGHLESRALGPATKARGGFLCDSGHASAIITASHRWSIRGGLINSYEASPGEIRLYGHCTFRLSRVPPIPLFHYAFGGGSTLERYEVILVVSAPDQATVLRRWMFSADQHTTDVAHNRDAVRAELSINPPAAEVTVKIYGLKTPFEATVSLR